MDGFFVLFICHFLFFSQSTVFALTKKLQQNHRLRFYFSIFCFNIESVFSTLISSLSNDAAVPAAALVFHVRWSCVHARDAICILAELKEKGTNYAEVVNKLLLAYTSGRNLNSVHASTSVKVQH
jgi:hypothetical protein